MKATTEFKGTSVEIEGKVTPSGTYVTITLSRAGKSVDFTLLGFERYVSPANRPEFLNLVEPMVRDIEAKLMQTEEYAKVAANLAALDAIDKSTDQIEKAMSY